jgi:hypothetical protein
MTLPSFDLSQVTSANFPCFTFISIPYSSCILFTSLYAFLSMRDRGVGVDMPILFCVALCVWALDFQRVGDPQYLALYPVLRLRNLHHHASPNSSL